MFLCTEILLVFTCLFFIICYTYKTFVTFILSHLISATHSFITTVKRNYIENGGQLYGDG